jgi:TRAP-type C4-dicarboxylate transport system permease small subunit
MTSSLRTALGLVLLLSLGAVVYPVVGVPWIVLLVAGGGLAYRASGRGGVRRWLVVLDETLFAGERWLVSACLLVMAGVVFLDVVWRSASGLDFATARNFAVGAFVLVFAGALTARAPSASLGARLGAGLGVYALLVGLTWLITQAENGFGWSQRLALVLVVWVGLIGGSMATRVGRHIAVDAVKRVVPDALRRGFEIAAGSVTVLTCGFLALVGGMYCRGNVDDWLMADMRAFVFESLPIPYWGATLAMPIGFGLMAARFLAATVAGGSTSDTHGLGDRVAEAGEEGAA